MRYVQSEFGTHIRLLGLIRNGSAEKIVEERLAQTPELYILAMAQYTLTAATEVNTNYITEYA